MAPKLSLLLISILLLSVIFTSAVARPMREFPVTSPKESDQAQISGFGETERVVDEDSNSDHADQCKNGDDEDDEECLMRRTLVAHVDYIYTQKDKKP